MTFSAQAPYNQLPALPPSCDLKTVAVLEACISARAALAELKGMTSIIPNPSILIRTIGVQEARVSSEIENIVTSTDDLYQALADTTGNTNPATKEVLNYHQALMTGVKAVREKQILSTNLFCDIASTIAQREMRVRSGSGTKIMDGSNAKTIYTPPEGETVVRTKLKELESFIHEDATLDPLIKMALIHYQFEAIHPFTDGNGRTGRILNVLYLIQQNLLTEPILYLSSYLIQNKSEYYLRLRNITEKQEWVEWVLYILKGITEIATLTRFKIVNIKDAMDKTLFVLKKELPKIASKELIEILFSYPYCKQKVLVDHLDITRQTAATYLNQMTKLGLVNPSQRGRETYYVNLLLIDALVPKDSAQVTSNDN